MNQPPLPLDGRVVVVVGAGSSGAGLSNGEAAALAYAKEHRKPGTAYDWVDKPGFVVFFNAPIVVGHGGDDMRASCGREIGYSPARSSVMRRPYSRRWRSPRKWRST